MLTGLHSVVIDVADLEVGVRDYARLLGVSPATVPDPPQAAPVATFVLSNMRLELRSPTACSTRLPASGQEGMAGLRFTLGQSPDASRVPGLVASPTVPIELVSELDVPAAPPALREGAPAARVLGLDHVVVATRDPERARRFFGEELGIRLALDRSFAERGLRLLFFRLGGITIEVASTLAEQSADAGTDVFHGLAWRVARIETLHARLRAAGLDVSELRAGHKPGTRVCSLREPVHGVPTLLIEHPSREGW